MMLLREAWRRTKNWISTARDYLWERFTYFIGGRDRVAQIFVSAVALGISINSMSISNTSLQISKMNQTLLNKRTCFADVNGVSAKFTETYLSSIASVTHLRNSPNSKRASQFRSDIEANATTLRQLTKSIRSYSKQFGYVCDDQMRDAFNTVELLNTLALDGDSDRIMKSFGVAEQDRHAANLQWLSDTDFADRCCLLLADTEKAGPTK